MSSEIEAGGIVLAAAALPTAVVFGAGWLAWQGGKALIEAGLSVSRQVEEKKRELELEEQRRYNMAVAAYTQLKDACLQTIGQLDVMMATAEVTSRVELERIKILLKEMCDKALPDDAARVESMVSFGYLKLEEAISSQSRIAEIQLTETQSGLYRGMSVADLMSDLRVALSVMEIRATVGRDIRAVDPAVYERYELDEQFSKVANAVVVALERLAELDVTYGICPADNNWFLSCFSGVEELLCELYKPTVTNKTLKNGIRRLEEALRRYKLEISGAERRSKTRKALYDIYVQVMNSFGEQAKPIEAFKKPEELESELELLKPRVERAQECQNIYRQLGAEGYLCYAWNYELEKLGYKVYSEDEIKEFSSVVPEHAKAGGKRIPFYRWNDEELTQLYNLADKCSLQMIVQKDGKVSMQVYSDVDSANPENIQRQHCKKMKLLYERLKNNWFIVYDFEETATPEQICMLAAVKDWNDDEIVQVKTNKEGHQEIANSHSYDWRKNGQKKGRKKDKKSDQKKLNNQNKK